jgi:hypothetical protein
MPVRWVQHRDPHRYRGRTPHRHRGMAERTRTGGQGEKGRQRQSPTLRGLQDQVRERGDVRSCRNMCPQQRIVNHNFRRRSTTIAPEHTFAAKPAAHRHVRAVEPRQLMWERKWDTTLAWLVSWPGRVTSRSRRLGITCTPLRLCGIQRPAITNACVGRRFRRCDMFVSAHPMCLGRGNTPAVA